MTATIAVALWVAFAAVVWWDSRRRWRALWRSLREHLEREPAR